MTRLLLTLALFIGLSPLVVAGTIKPNVDDDKYIEYGAKHKCVVKLSGEYIKDKDKDITGKFAASGVVIKPRIILTATHILHNIKNIYVIKDDQEQIKILFAVSLNKYTHDKPGENDISVCYLEKNIELDFYPELYDSNDEIGKVCSIAGYGASGNNIEGVKFYDGKKRAGSNIVDGLFNGMLTCSINTLPHTELEILIAVGDSGGGLFINQKLAGINSCVVHKNKTTKPYVDNKSCHTRISLHKKWLDLVVKELENFDVENSLEEVK
jgi:hypothetical protein